MIDRTEHGDVSALRLSWWRSRLAGLQVHIYVVRGVLIDTGFPAAEHVVAALVDGGDIRGAMVTHQHEDHAGNARFLARRGIPIGIADDTLAIVRAHYRIAPYRRFTWRSMPALDIPFTPFHDDQLSLIATPGHSADHHAVWDNATGTVFLGDLFLGVKVKIAHHYENPLQQVASIRAILARSPSRAFCAHRGAVSLDALAAKADWIEETVAHMRALARAGHSEASIRKQLLGAHTATHWVSAGEYSADNLVRAALREAPKRAAGS